MLGNDLRSPRVFVCYATRPTLQPQCSGSIGPHPQHHRRVDLSSALSHNPPLYCAHARHFLYSAHVLYSAHARHFPCSAHVLCYARCRLCSSLYRDLSPALCFFRISSGLCLCPDLYFSLSHGPYFSLSHVLCSSLSHGLCCVPCLYPGPCPDLCLALYPGHGYGYPL